jgi:hypothetical protein
MIGRARARQDLFLLPWGEGGRGTRSDEGLLPAAASPRVGWSFPRRRESGWTPAILEAYSMGSRLRGNDVFVLDLADFGARFPDGPSS